MVVTSTRSGDVLAGRYRLIDLLTESGGGRFWRAHDTVLERYVALHVIDEDDPRAPGLVEAARASAAVLDPRILRVLDAATEAGRCFVVNEWGTGTSLDILVTHAGPLGPRRAAWLVADVAEAIATAHAAGVAHGRLNPENVLIDRYGAVRLIGLCVDAALHGIVPGDTRGDLEDIGGLLYCALTATWPGPSGSIVPAAPREGGDTLSPRQVRAGVPGPLDLLWREFGCGSNHDRRRRRSHDHPDIGSAPAIAAQLREFVGDPTGMPEALARSIPPVNELGPVWLPAVADPLPHDSSLDDIPVVPAVDPPELDPDRAAADAEDPPAALVAEGDGESPGPTEAPRPDPAGEPADPADPADPATGTEAATEAGMPVFVAEDDVQWLRTRSTPPPPPPPFEEPPERPLFAAGQARADARSDRSPWQWDDPLSRDRAAAELSQRTGHLPATATSQSLHDPHGHGDLDDRDDQVPGRSWLRLAMAVGAALLLLVAVVVAVNLGRGRTALGGQRDTTAGPATSSTEAARAQVLEGVRARDFDPLGSDGEENPRTLGALLDGDPRTTWSTQTYRDQLGTEPPALKSGVGLVLDLGDDTEVASVALRLRRGQGTVALYASSTVPTTAPQGTPLATADGSGQLVLAAGPTADDRVTARYLTLWWTALPRVEGGYRAEISEIVVRGV